MTVQNIHTLSRHTLFRALLLNGACIAERTADGFHILLFQVCSQYVEVFLDKDEDTVHHSRTFEDSEELRPYLEAATLKDWKNSKEMNRQENLLV